MHGNPFTHLSWHKFAPRLARGVHRGRDRSARLRRFVEAAGRRRPCRLFVPQHGARQRRGDGRARLQEVHGRRPRPRRARAASHVPRSSRQGRARRDPRHHPAAPSAQPHDQGVGPVLLALVLQHPAGADAREDDGRRPGLVHPEEARQDHAGPELLRQGGARRIHALLPQPGDHPRHLRGLSRHLRRRSRDGHQGFRRRQEDHLSGADPVGRDRRRRPQPQAGPGESGRDYAADIRGAKALPCGHYLSEEAPEETYQELREFFLAR